MRKRLVVATIVLATIIAISALVSVSYAEHFLFRRDLSLTLINQTDSGLPECDYIANITDSGVDTGGFIYLRVEPAMFSNQQHPMYLEILNPENVQLDTITLTFNSSHIVFVYFQGHYDVAYTYSFISNDCDVAKIQVDNDSGAASGNSAYKFILTTQSIEDFTMHLTIDLSMHYNTPLQLTELHATAPIDVRLHQEIKP
jgi:hypothetical protein